MELRTGLAAPAFTLPQADGQPLSLEEFVGRKVVLYFYPKDDTSGCTQEARDFNALRAEFKAADTAIVGISPDSPKSHEKFAGKYGLDLLLASDEDKATLQAYGVWVEKSMYGRRYMGVERTTILIDREGRIARVWTKVKVAGHALEVLAVTRTL